MSANARLATYRLWRERRERCVASVARISALPNTPVTHSSQPSAYTTPRIASLTGSPTKNSSSASGAIGMPDVEEIVVVAGGFPFVAAVSVDSELIFSACHRVYIVMLLEAYLLLLKTCLLLLKACLL